MVKYDDLFSAEESGKGLKIFCTLPLHNDNAATGIVQQIAKRQLQYFEKGHDQPTVLIQIANTPGSIGQNIHPRRRL